MDLSAEAIEAKSNAKAPARRLLGIVWCSRRCASERRAAEDQCLDRRAREIELLGDLPVGAAAPLAEDDRTALKVGHVVECLFEPDELLARAVVPRGDLLQDLRVAQDLVLAAATARAYATAARVLRDREEPVRLQARDDSALESA